VRQCCICWVIFGEKEPFKDKSVTHGYCPKCFRVEMKKIEKLQKIEVIQGGMEKIQTRKKTSETTPGSR